MRPNKSKAIVILRDDKINGAPLDWVVSAGENPTAKAKKFMEDFSDNTRRSTLYFTRTKDNKTKEYDDFLSLYPHDISTKENLSQIKKKLVKQNEHFELR